MRTHRLAFNTNDFSDEELGQTLYKLLQLSGKLTIVNAGVGYMRVEALVPHSTEAAFVAEFSSFEE